MVFDHYVFIQGEHLPLCWNNWNRVLIHGQCWGTNLSVKLGHNQWDSNTNRLMLMDRRDFNKLGLGLDDLIQGYLQTVLSTIAIDQMCIRLISTKGRFKQKLFKSLNNDNTLLNEIML